MDSIWIPYGFYMDLWIGYGPKVDSIWVRYGFNMDSIRIYASGPVTYLNENSMRNVATVALDVPDPLE